MAKTKEKYLFAFQTKAGINAEVFASDMMDAQEKVCRVLGITEIEAPLFMTENFDCPKCKVMDCNYDG